MSFQLWFIPIDVTWNNPWLRIQNINIRMNNKIHSHGYYSDSSVSVGIYLSKFSQHQLWFISIEEMSFAWSSIIHDYGFKTSVSKWIIEIHFHLHGCGPNSLLCNCDLFQLRGCHWGDYTQSMITDSKHQYQSFDDRHKSLHKSTNRQSEKVEEMLQPKSKCINQDSRF